MFFEHVVLVTVVLKSLLQLTVCFCAAEFCGAVFVVISADLPSILQSVTRVTSWLPGQLLDINCQRKDEIRSDSMRCCKLL